MKYTALIFSVVVVAAVMVSSCLGQIHFSPTWGTGKRSMSPTGSLFGARHFNEDVSGGGGLLSAGGSRVRRGGTSNSGSISSSTRLEGASTSSSSSSRNSYIANSSPLENDILALLGVAGEDSLHYCAQETEYRVLLEMAMVLTREVKRLSSCMTGYSQQ